jgi:hypothetical protein
MAATISVLVVAVGAIAIHERDAGGLQFSRDLPSWHQLTDEDVRSRPGMTEATVVDRYTTEPVEEGQPITVSHLGPRLPRGSLEGEAVVVLPSIDQLAEVLQAGDIVTLREVGARTRICPVRILEVRRGKEHKAMAIGAVPRAQVPTFSDVKDHDGLLALRVWGYADGSQESSGTELCG